MAIRTLSHFVGSSVDTYINVATVDDPATDVFAISGSASKTIVVTRLDVTCLTGSQATMAVFFVRRDSLGTGGVTTSNFSTLNVNIDRPSVPAVTAILRGWTTSPKPVGAEVVTLSRRNVTPAGFASDNFIGTASLEPIFGSVTNPHEFTPGIVLAGADNHLVATIDKNSGGRQAPLSGLAFFVTAQWIEIG